MSEEDVDYAIIRPMCRLYPPPRHLRADEETLDAALAAYRKALARFDGPVLERAWQLSVERNALWCWPKPAELVQAAEEARRAAHQPGEAEAWVAKAMAMADAYTWRFMRISQHAARAREGGYEAALKGFVRAASWVQAQYLLDRQDVAYDSATLFGGDPRRDREAEEAFFNRARAQAEAGHIRVHIPPERVKSWQADALGQQRKR